MEKGIYKHNKSGNQYELLHIALVEFSKDKVAVYKGVTSGVIWVRDLKQFQERFTFVRNYEQELSETVLIEHGENFIHLRTNNVPEWVKRLERINKQIIYELEAKKDCKYGQHSGDTGKCQHPNEKRINWHDSAILCSECDCIIEQFGESIDPPHKLA